MEHKDSAPGISKFLIEGQARLKVRHGLHIVAHTARRSSQPTERPGAAVPVTQFPVQRQALLAECGCPQKVASVPCIVAHVRKGSSTAVLIRQGAGQCETFSVECVPCREIA